MGQNKGLITKIKENYCIVVTKEGEFKKVPLPRQPVRVGQEITFHEGGFLHKWAKYSLLVASLLMVALGINLFNQPAVAPAAYVSLDINPSIELAVDKEQKVISTKAFNEDGKQLLTNLRLEQLDLYQAMEKILEEAIAENYVKNTGKNIILSAVYPTEPDLKVVDETKIQNVINSALDQGRFPGEVVVYHVDDKIRREAAQLQITMGKAVIYEYAKNSGNQVTVDDLKASSIVNLVSQGKLKDPADYTSDKLKFQIKTLISKVKRDSDEKDDNDIADETGDEENDAKRQSNQKQNDKKSNDDDDKNEDEEKDKLSNHPGKPKQPVKKDDAKNDDEDKDSEEKDKDNEDKDKNKKDRVTVQKPGTKTGPEDKKDDRQNETKDNDDKDKDDLRTGEKNKDNDNDNNRDEDENRPPSDHRDENPQNDDKAKDQDDREELEKTKDNGKKN